jgi:hypothetical protein
MNAPARETEPQLIGEILPGVLRQLAADAEDELAAIRLRALADRLEFGEEEEEAA